MHLFANKKRLFLTYGFFVLLSAAVFLINRYLDLSPWSLTLTFFFFIFWPGFYLSRIFKIQYSNYLDQFINWLVLGFIFNFSLNFLAMLLALKLSTLIAIYLSFLAVLFFVSLILDIFRHQEETVSTFHLKDLWKLDSLTYLLIVFIALLLLTGLLLTGSLFQGGDPIYHISILRRVIENQPLTVENLSYVKSQVHIVYAFPLWQIFLGILNQIFHTDIFILWGIISFPLLILVFLAWYWVFRQILPTRHLAITALAIFMVFFSAGTLFRTLPIPHTLSQILLLPLSLGLAIRYVFDSKSNYKHLIIISLFLSLTAAIHLTAYFTFLLIMIIFTLVYAVFKYKDDDFKSILRKMIWVTFSSFLIIVPLALALELLGKKTVSNFFQSFGAEGYPQNVTYASFRFFDMLAQYAYLGLPLLLLFLRKERRFIFVLALFLVVPLTYWHVLRLPLIRLLGFVFMDRLYANTVWHFVVWAIVLGFLMVLIDRMLSKIEAVSRYLRFGIDGGLLVLSGFLIWLQTKKDIATGLKNKIFSPEINLWLSQNYLWLIIILFTFALGIFIYQKYFPKLQEFFKFHEMKDAVAKLCLVFFLIFVLMPLDYKIIPQAFRTGFQVFSRSSAGGIPEAETFALGVTGGPETIAFIKNSIPAKAVFYTYGGYFFLPTLADVHMPAYDSNADTRFSQLFDPSMSINEKLTLLQTSQIEYILIAVREEAVINCLSQYPEYFQKIYDNQSALIYKVNIEKVKKDANDINKI